MAADRIEDSISACTNVIGNSCNVKKESKKPLIHSLSKYIWDLNLAL